MRRITSAASLKIAIPRQWLRSLPVGSAGHLGDLLYPRQRKQKKAGVVKYPEAFDHVGLLFNEPPGTAELPFI